MIIFDYLKSRDIAYHVVNRYSFSQSNDDDVSFLQHIYIDDCVIDAADLFYLISNFPSFCTVMVKNDDLILEYALR